jgi:hypothetical protein
MSDPITAMAVGAALGGGTSLAQGKGFGSALKSAAIGGALGGGGSALGGLMGGAGATGAAGGASTGSGLLSSLQGVATTPVSMGTGGFASGIGGQVIPNVAANVAPVIGTAAQTATQNFIPQHLVGNSTGMANYVPGGPFNPGDISNFVENTPNMPGASQAVASAPDFTPILGRSAGATGGGYNPSFFGRMGDMIGNPLSSLSTSDKVGIGLKSVDLFNQPQEQMPTPQVMPVIPGNPALVSAPLYNVAPNVGMQEGNELGLPNLLSRMPLTEEELLKLQQQMQTTGFRGR